MTVGKLRFKPQSPICLQCEGAVYTWSIDLLKVASREFLNKFANDVISLEKEICTHTEAHLKVENKDKKKKGSGLL